MPAQSTLTSPQQLVDAALAPILAYNAKDWSAVRSSVAPGLVYDEVSTGRQAQGVENVIALWQSWAAAFPDSRAEIHSKLPSGNTVTVEVTWRGTHQGPLPTASGTIPASGKRIEVRACFVVELQNDKPARERHYFDMATLLRQIGVAV